MNCDMCGKNIENFFEVDVEGSVLKLCKGCSAFGKVIKSPSQKKRISDNAGRKIVRRPVKEETIEIIVSDYGKLVKNAREKMGLKQEELAKKLNEKESLISHIESGKKEPRLELARKLERFFGIKLVEVIAEKETYYEQKKKSDQMTIGDMIKIRKK